MRDSGFLVYEVSAFLPAGSVSDSGLTVDPTKYEIIIGTVTMSGWVDDQYVGPYNSTTNIPD